MVGDLLKPVKHDVLEQVGPASAPGGWGGRGARCCRQGRDELTVPAAQLFRFDMKSWAVNPDCDRGLEKVGWLSQRVVTLSVQVFRAFVALIYSSVSPLLL